MGEYLEHIMSWYTRDCEGVSQGNLPIICKIRL